MKKIILTFFIGLLLINSISILSLLLLPSPALAQIVPKRLIDIPNLQDFTAPVTCGRYNEKKCIPWIGQYIEGVYNYSLGIVGILSAVVLMFGGLTWITAGGNPSKIGEAKAWITASLTGLILMMASYTILLTINPELVAFDTIEVIAFKSNDLPQGYCEYEIDEDSATQTTCINTDKESCTEKFLGTFDKDFECKNGEKFKLETGCCLMSYAKGIKTCNTEFKTDCDKRTKQATTELTSNFTEGKCSGTTCVAK